MVFEEGTEHPGQLFMFFHHSHQEAAGLGIGASFIENIQLGAEQPDDAPMILKQIGVPSVISG